MSESQRLDEILPEVMQNIRRRCEQNPDNKVFKPTASKHRHRVVSAVSDFMFRRSSRPKRLSGERNNKKEQKRLW